MATDGPRQAGAVAEFDDGWTAWSSVAGAIADDNGYATVALDNSFGNYLDWTQFGFPVLGVVTAVQVEVACKVSAGIGRVSNVQLLVAGDPAGDPVTVNHGMTGSETYVSDSIAVVAQFGTTISAAQANGSGFGVRVQFDVTGVGTISVDACRLTLTYTPVPPFVLDDGADGHSETAGWTTVGIGGLDPPYGTTYRYAAAGSGSIIATWQQAGLPPGAYDVQATWVAFSNRASNAPYRIYDGATLLGTVRVDQRTAPAGASYGGAVFQSLGVFTIASGPLKVTLADDADDYVIADAVRVAVPAGGATFARPRSRRLRRF